MPYPRVDPRTQFCIVVTRGGVTVYGNQAAMATLSRWLAWISRADPDEHNECHLTWHLLTSFRKRNNVWVLFESAIRSPRRRASPKDYDVTFMAVSNKDLAVLRKFRKSGVVPTRWLTRTPEEPRRRARPQPQSRTSNPEPRTPNPEPRVPSPESPALE